MNYKDSIELFRLLYRTECFNNKLTAKDFTTNQVMYFLSSAQLQINNLYHVAEKKETVPLTANTYLYLLNTGGNKVSKGDILYIKTIANERITAPYNLTAISKSQLSMIEKIAGLPTKYTVYKSDSGLTLEINTLPEYSYHSVNYPEYLLTLTYIPKLVLFDSNSGTSSNTTFPATGDNAWVEATQTGIWLLPEHWHSLIIDGAIAMIFASKKAEWIMNCEKLKSETYSYIDLNLPYANSI